MTPEAKVAQLQSFFADVNMKTLSNRVAVRIRHALLPRGCTPSEIDFLVTFPLNQDTPNGWFVKEQVRLVNGAMPNANSTIIDGETWFGYSYRFSWDPNQDPLYQYVESALHRFAKPA